MRLILFFLVTFIMQVNVYAYDEDITIKKDNASLETVFREIENQCQYRFFFNETLMKHSKPVSINVEKASLLQVLEECFKAQPVLTYSIVEKTIIVKRKESDLNTGVKDFGKLAELRGLVASEHGPVQGATVAVKGTTKVTTTNNSGEFLLNDVDEKAVIVVSSISHHEQEVRLNGKGLISIILNEKVSELDEQIVVAYNKSTAKSNVGALTVIKGDQVRDIPFRSVDKALQGYVPGLLVTSGTGQPGGGMSNFVLRGIGTGTEGIFGSTVRNPLIVIDGVPVSQDPVQWTYSLDEPPVTNPMAQLNPSDIETITVLKDAAAIALYGSKASNGVILITTKKGKAGKTAFSFRHQTDISTRLKGKIKLLSQEEYLELVSETLANTDPYYSDHSKVIDTLKTLFPVKSDGSFYPATNWENLLYEKYATTFINEISMSGGNEKSNFYLNLEYTKQNGIVKNTGYDRKSVRFNFENGPTEWIRIGMNSTLSYNIQKYASLLGGTWPIGLATWNSPLNPVREENGEYLLNFSFPEIASNPVAANEYNLQRNTSFRGLGKFYAELMFLKDFSFTSNLGIDFMLMEAKEKFDPRLFDDVTYTIGRGRLQERDTRNANLITTNTLQYNKTIANQHNLNIVVGQEAQILSQRYLEGTATNLTIPDYDQLTGGGSASGAYSKQTLSSYFGQTNYSFKNKYHFSGSIRNDGSSRFGEKNRQGTYWSTGIGWVVSAESFMTKSAAWLNYLKIRSSMGAAGNSFAIDKFTRYDILLIRYYQNNMVVSPYLPGNPNIKWEETFNWDIGLESRLWNNRISLTADIYNRKTYDVIYTTTLPYSTGFTTVLDNIGDIENKGVELSLSIAIIKNKNFNWTINSNWSKNKNILVKANVPLSSVSGSTLANEEGRNFNSFYLYSWGGVNPADGSPQWIDTTGKPNSDISAAKRKFVGKPQPDGFGSITSIFTFKNFTLSAMFYYQYGNEIYNFFVLTNDGGVPFAQQDKRALDRWRKPGDIAVNPKRMLYNSTQGYNSTRYLYSGDHIRLQNVSLSYTLPKKVIESMGLSKLKVYAQAYNLALWSNFPGEDVANTTVQGGNNLSYPNQKSFSLGVNVNF